MRIKNINLKNSRISQVLKVDSKLFIPLFLFAIISLLSLQTRIEIIEPLVLLLIIFISFKFNKKSIISVTIFAIFIMGIQDLYTLEKNFFEYLAESALVIFAASYIYNRTSSMEKINNQLREERRFLEITLNSIADGVIVTDKNGKIERINKTVEKLTKWGVEEAEGKSVGEIFKIRNAKNNKKLEIPIKKVIEKGSIINLANDTKLIARDGTEYYIEDSTAPIRDAEGETHGVVFIFKDITKRSKMEKQIIKLNRIYKVLRSINQIIVKTDDIKELLDKAAKISVITGGYDTTWIARLSDDKKKLNILSVSGKECIFLQGKKAININIEKENLNIYEKAIYHNKDIVTNIDLNSELKCEHCGSNSVLILEVFEKIWGIMVFCSDKENRFTKEEMDLLREVSSDISLGIEKIIAKRLNIEAEAKLKKSEEEYRSLFENSPIGIFKKNGKGKLKLINSAMAEILECDNVEEVYDIYPDLNKDLFVNPERQKTFLRTIKKAGKVKNFVFRAYDKNRNIKLIQMSAMINLEESKEGDILIEGFAKDITERKRRQEKIRYLGFHDALTGLYNRYYIEDMIKRIDTKRNLPISFIMVDINNLKLINDSYGHNKGDQLIIETSNIIKDFCRKDDVIARWGGDEFVILLPKTSFQEGEEIIQRINDREKIDDLKTPVSIALGAATKTREEESIIDILNKAEDRMYTNKFANRNSARSIVILSFLNTLKEKSYETETHVNRMSKMSKKFAKSLKLSQEDTDKLLMLSLLHDIGKISVPEKILNKKERLTNKEWEIIKSHPAAGQRILTSIPRFAKIAEAVLHHHERWDGTGYPDGLIGTEIPRLSRILSIIDSYDVMISGRPYKKAMTKAEVIKELNRCAGSQFDPNLIEEFIKILRSNDS